MKEITDIVAAYDEAVKLGKKTALATVVLVEGSAYRRAGARMLITEDGELTGAISGGCLEGDALRKARLVILQQEALLVTYDTTDDDDAKLGVGLGCNGIIHILIEPIINDREDNPIALFRLILVKRQYGVLATVFSIDERKAPQPGTCLCMTDEQVIITKSILKDHKLAIINDAESVLGERQSTIKNYKEGVVYTAFIELVKPVISLVIAGAGNDAIPLTKMAGVLGWDITIVDGRNNYAVSERFPQARRVIVARPEEILSHININEWTAIVMMTHNYNYEMAFLKELSRESFNYVGILGPKKKLNRMLCELQEQGIILNNEQLDRLHGPVGLDIGSEGAEEIALSVLAEIKAVLSNRNGYSLKYKADPIHVSEMKPLASK
ncbi:XdhC family protein [Mucilaginibacter jinjuensis]|uniref:XdhC family protein n=1 Tax=Mucilaginibacter jinjuensis TaxID=1176721 RepID=A0ABY7T2L2_9SPHI|nr:XdhC/CoxI family protein [Mucilaginibacter jinjuensis]WCT10685.1 XdhC family protein [Mucilaginibacter jinjuensis]